MKLDKIRNFAIIAHIDHGKSTLADRILEITSTISERNLKDQHMDSMDLERERGITIKLNAAQIKYKDYLFHVIDTPGHVDFSYEVSRSLKACEGAILLVDATQGVEAQTLANVYLALENNLTIIPVVNKIDLPLAEPNRVKKEISSTLGIDVSQTVMISARTGKNVEKLLDEIIKSIPAPKKTSSQELKALVFDSYFDAYRGVIILIRIFQGQIKVGERFQFIDSKKEFEVFELGIKNPEEIKKTMLSQGEVGWIAASIRDSKDVAIGDTITGVNNPATTALPGYRKVIPVVFTGLYPVENKDYQMLRESLEKISLSDSSITFEQESSQALGNGFRVGFLGMLHMEVIQERLKREFNMSVIATAPSVEFRIHLTNGKELVISNPSLMPDPTKISQIKEPYIKASIIVPEIYLGLVMDLCQNRRGKYLELTYLDGVRRKVEYEMPLAEIIFDFFDNLKSISKGYASFDYEPIGYKPTKIVKIEILLNYEKVDAFSFMIYRTNAERRGREIIMKLKDAIPRHNFAIPVQATINGKVIARETIKPYRKDVTSNLYGGDRTRRDKLLKKQKAGKKRARQFGKVQVPPNAFIKILKTN